MKILTLMPYSPVPANFGGAMRIYYLLRSLASEHEVTVVTYGTPDTLKSFQKEFGNQVKDIHIVPVPRSAINKRLYQCYSVLSRWSYSHICSCSNEMQEKINELLANNDFDAVHTEFPHLGNLEINKDLIRVLDAHNVEYDNFRRMWLKCRSPLKKWFYFNEYKKVYREEIASFRKQNLILTTSKEDMKIIKKDVDNVPGFVVPNGVDTSFFTPSGQEPDPYSLVFTGMMGYLPNNDGMRWFLDEVFPLILKEVPEAKIYIVGSKPPEHLKRRQSDRVVVTGFVDDVRPYVWKTSVFVVPLRMGSGTRLKVVEAMAMGKAIVSTSLGCEGIPVTDGEHLLIADDPIASARAVLRLFDDPWLAAALGKSGRALVEREIRGG
jgi:glycosyltransferase involved in cell wall biosynthesis